MEIQYGASPLSVASGAGIGGLSYTQTGVATQRLGLEAAHAELRGAIEELSKRVHQLEARLNPVLCPSAPQEASGDSNKAPTPIRSSALDTVFSAKRAVDAISQHVDRVTNRVEL